MRFRKKWKKQVIFSLFDAVLLLKKNAIQNEKKNVPRGEDTVMMLNACARGGLRSFVIFSQRTQTFLRFYILMMLRKVSVVTIAFTPF